MYHVIVPASYHTLIILSQSFMKIGAMIRKLRYDKKLSQCEIAEQVGISQSTYFAWENNRSSPRTEQCIRLAEALGVDLSDLISVPQKTDAHQVNNLEQGTLSTQMLYDNLISSQNQLIRLQQQRIEQLENDIHQLHVRVEIHSRGDC